jgi:tryptophan 2,3-dioxygenase
MLDNLLTQLSQKLQHEGQDPQTYLKGQQYLKPMNYWDYVLVEPLLNLQFPRTHYKDEKIFIVYHQITELVLNLIIHELEQLINEPLKTSLIIDKLGRMDRYADLLISSFSIMNKGMSYDDYNEFRLSLAPASGFQSVQFRKIELMCTPIQNLVPPHLKQHIGLNQNPENTYPFLYWQEAGIDRKTGEKSRTLLDFEQKYKSQLLALANDMQTRNLSMHCQAWLAAADENERPALLQALKSFDAAFNIRWPMVHLETARTYLLAKGERKAATGGSHWEKYLHPAFQKRIFFPPLYSIEELENWGKEEA